MPYNSLTDSQHAAVLEALAAGLNNSQAEARTGVNRATVRKIRLSSPPAATASSPPPLPSGGKVPIRIVNAGGEQADGQALPAGGEQVVANIAAAGVITGDDDEQAGGEQASAAGLDIPDVALPEPIDIVGRLPHDGDTEDDDDVETDEEREEREAEEALERQVSESIAHESVKLSQEKDWPQVAGGGGYGGGGGQPPVQVPPGFGNAIRQIPSADGDFSFMEMSVQIPTALIALWESMHSTGRLLDSEGNPMMLGPWIMETVRVHYVELGYQLVPVISKPPREIIEQELAELRQKIAGGA